MKSCCAKGLRSLLTLRTLAPRRSYSVHALGAHGSQAYAGSLRRHPTLALRNHSVDGVLGQTQRKEQIARGHKNVAGT